MRKLKLIITAIFVLTVTLLNSVTVGASSDDYIILNDVDNPKTVEQFKYDFISILDPQDGDLRNNVYVIVDNYTGNERKIGEFIVVYGVMDSSGVETSFAFTVKNVDITGPTITYNSDVLNIPLNTDMQGYQFNFTAIDTISGNVTNTIDIINDELIDTSILGVYNITVTASDAFGNITSEDLQVNVIDATKPVLNVPNYIIKKSDYILPSNFFMTYVTASDDVDGDISGNIEVVKNDYLGNGNVPGTYEIILSVTDNAGNKTEESILVTVDKKLDALLVIDTSTVLLDVNQQYTTEDYINLLKHIGEIPDNDYIVTEVLDTYQNHFGEQGSYVKKFDLIAANGTEYSLNLDVEVIKANLDVIEDTPGVGESIFSFFLTWWLWLGIVIVVVFILYRGSKLPSYPKYNRRR